MGRRPRADRSPEVKWQIVQEGIKSGNVSETCRRHGISPSLCIDGETRGLRGSVHVAFEEGTCAAWLHDLLKPHVTKVLVSDPRKNSLLKAGNKNDRIDARKLANPRLVKS
jgi:hypothetical protein